MTVSEAHHFTHDLIMHYYPLYRADWSACLLQISVSGKNHLKPRLLCFLLCGLLVTRFVNVISCCCALDILKLDAMKVKIKGPLCSICRDILA